MLDVWLSGVGCCVEQLPQVSMCIKCTSNCNNGFDRPRLRVYLISVVMNRATNSFDKISLISSRSVIGTTKHIPSLAVAILRQYLCTIIYDREVETEMGKEIILLSNPPKCLVDVYRRVVRWWLGS